MKLDPYYQRQKCRPMILVSGNIRCMGIFAGVPLGGASNESGVVEYGNFWRFRWLRLRKLQRYGKQYYMTMCYPCRLVTDYKMNDLE